MESGLQRRYHEEKESTIVNMREHFQAKGESVACLREQIFVAKTPLQICESIFQTMKVRCKSARAIFCCQNAIANVREHFLGQEKSVASLREHFFVAKMPLQMCESNFLSQKQHYKSAGAFSMTKKVSYKSARAIFCLREALAHL
jgi:hypothetical protein